jgi:hypothetical protein
MLLRARPGGTEFDLFVQAEPSSVGCGYPLTAAHVRAIKLLR